MADVFAGFGVNETGFNLPSFTQVQSAVRQSMEDKLGFPVTDSSNMAGIMADVTAEALLRLWEEQYNIWVNGQLAASGVGLAHVVQQVGIYPRSNVRSTGVVTLDAALAGHLVPAGAIFEDDVSGDQWRTLTDGNTQSNVSVEAVEFGPIEGGPTHTYTVVTSHPFWTGVTWSAAADVGFATESDSELRAEHASILTGTGQADPGGIPIRAEVLAVAGVVDCTVEINDTAGTVNGVDAHSFRATVLGGTDADIGVAIWNSQRLGGRGVGVVPASVTDLDGDNHVVYFDRPTSLDIYVNVDADTNKDFPPDGADQITAIVGDYLANLGIGRAVEHAALFTLIYTGVSGINLLTVELGLSEGTEAATNITVTKQQQPVLADLDLVIT